MVQFRFSKKAKKIWKYLPNDFHSKFQIYWEIFLQFLCCLFRKNPELYHCWELFTRSNPKLFWFSKSRNHEFQIFLLFIIFLWKIPICIWLIYKKNPDFWYRIPDWELNSKIVWIVISNNVLVFSNWDRFLQSFLIHIYKNSFLLQNFEFVP